MSNRDTAARLRAYADILTHVRGLTAGDDIDWDALGADADDVNELDMLAMRSLDVAIGAMRLETTMLEQTE